MNYPFVSFADVNECLGNPCHADAECWNTDGSFICTCYIGYSGNGTTCSGKIECYFRLHRVPNKVICS